MCTAQYDKHTCFIYIVTIIVIHYFLNKIWLLDKKFDHVVHY